MPFANYRDRGTLFSGDEIEISESAFLMLRYREIITNSSTGAVFQAFVLWEPRQC